MKKKIIVLGCNHSQIPYIKELKKKYFIIGCDKNKNAPGKKFVDIFYTCAYDNLKILKKICLLNKDIEIVFSASSQFSIIGVSHCKKILNKDYIDNKACKIILNKHKFYNYLKNNKINYPKTTTIKNKKELKNKIVKDINYYLKSDHSKNPNYIYSGKVSDFIEKVNWKKDRYFKKNYVLQEEIIGKNIRVNVVKKRLVFFDFFKQKKLNKKDLGKFNFKQLEENILYICKDLGISEYIVKFDIIINYENYYFLDIGIDPPYRLKKYFDKNKRNFYRFYINHIIYQK